MDSPQNPIPALAAANPPRKRRRGVAILPSLFTLGNLLCGFAAINFASLGKDVFDPPFRLAGYLIFLAMVFDMFDGFVARLTRSTSDFGAELDSLADVVSFGIAPAFLAVRLMAVLLQTPGPSGQDYWQLLGPFSDQAELRLFWVIACIYVSCTALRLARFNVTTQADVLSHMYFRGLPSPAAAAIVRGSVVFFEWLAPTAKPIPVTQEMHAWLQTVVPYSLLLMLLLSALMMVSRFSYVHLINRFLRGRKQFRKLVGFLLLVMLIVWQPQITVLAGIYAYALSAPVMAAWRKIRKKPLVPPGAGVQQGLKPGQS